MSYPLACTFETCEHENKRLLVKTEESSNQKRTAQEEIDIQDLYKNNGTQPTVWMMHLFDSIYHAYLTKSLPTFEIPVKNNNCNQAGDGSRRKEI